MANTAVIKMQKELHTSGMLDEKPYLCKVLKYDARNEAVYLVLENDFLTAISLDAIYECSMQRENNEIVCAGRVSERFHSKYGNVLKMEIMNGFYKINLKSVDKQ